jgi:hypothetical protein
VFSLSHPGLIFLNDVRVSLEADGLVEGEPRDVILDELVRDVTLNARVVSRVLAVQIDDEEHVLPQVVLLLYMMHKSVC